MTLDTGVIADDLTGGLLVAGFLEAEGIECPVVTGAGDVAAAAAGGPALVVARRIRFASPTQAVAEFETAAEALVAAGARQVYYKYCATFDSTDDGNIGPCADALMRLGGVDRLGFCPAFPGVGITVYQGHMFLRDQLLNLLYNQMVGDLALYTFVYVLEEAIVPTPRSLHSKCQEFIRIGLRGLTLWMRSSFNLSSKKTLETCRKRDGTLHTSCGIARFARLKRELTKLFWNVAKPRFLGLVKA